MGRGVEAMRAIDASSQQIAEIVSVIDGTAFQTDFLALNPGCEGNAGLIGSADRWINESTEQQTAHQRINRRRGRAPAAA